MKVCVLNTGSSHAIYRTIALAEFCEIEAFIQIGPPNHHHSALKEAGIKVIQLNYKGFISIKIARYLKTQTSSDYYVCHYAYGMHIDACIYAKLKNIAVIAMGSDILFKGNSRLEFLKKKFVLKNVTFISSKSEEISTILEKWKSKAMIVLNYWGESHQHFYHVPESEAKKILNIEVDKNIFLSSRTIGRLYNIDLIAKAFVEINKRVNNSYFIFAGRIGDQAYLNEIKEFFKEHGLTNYKIIGDLKKEELNLYYNASKIVYSFVDHEGFPNTFFEVFACKVNLICGEIETLINFSKESHAILNLCNFDERSIANKTIEMLSNPNQSNQAIERNYKVFLDYGNLNNNARKFHDELLRTISTRSINFSIIIKLLLFDTLLIIDKKLKKIFF